MSSVYVGQIILFAGQYAPRYFHFCDGSTLSIQQYAALYSLLGIAYGGDGHSTFKLPDLRGRVAMHYTTNGSTLGGLSYYNLGQTGGAENVSLSSDQLPAHQHFANCVTAVGTTPSPSGALWAEGPTGGSGNKTTPSPNQYTTTAANATMASNAIQAAGSGQAHSNIQPILALNYIIALQGVYPQRP